MSWTVVNNSNSNTSMDWNPIAAAGGSVLNFVGGLISGHKQRKAQAAINAQNIAMQRETNDLNYRINQENNEFNREQTWKMFNAQNQWNSASNQMKLAREAGINPFVAAQEQGLGDSVNHDAAATTAGVPSMVAPRADMIDSSAFNSLHAFSELANVFKTLAETDKTDAEAQQIKKMAADTLRQAKAAADAQEWQVHVSKLFDIGDRKQAYDSAVEAYKILCQDTLNKVKEGQLIDEKVLSEQYTWMNKMAQQVLYQKQSDKLDIELKHYEERYTAEIREINSRRRANDASAADSYSHVAVNDSQAKVNSAQEISLKEVAKLSHGELESLASEIVGAYIDENGLHVDPEKRAQVQHELEKQLRYETKQRRQDYYNPARVVGNLLGPATSVYNTSVLKKVMVKK